MQKKIALLLFGLLVSANVTGCTKAESKVQFKTREKAQSEINSALSATHASISELAKKSQAFELVSQPVKSSSSPQSIEIYREWLLSPSGQSTPEMTRDSVIASCESLLQKYIPADTENLKFDAEAAAEESSIRM